MTSDPVSIPDIYIQEIVWKRLKAQRPATRGRYRIRNVEGHESIGHYLPEEGDDCPGWVTLDFDGSIIYWAELNS